MDHRPVLFIAITVLVMASITQGAILTSPDVVQIAPPTSIVDGTLTSNTAVHLFRERTITLSRDFRPDLDPDNHSYALGQMSLVNAVAAGTTIDSYYVHFDSVSGQIGRGSNPHIVISTGEEFITFCHAVVGVLYRDFKLNNTDVGLAGQPMLGLDSVTYDYLQPARGSEPTTTSAPDSIMIDGTTVRFTLNTSEPFDDFRILTLSGPDCGIDIVAHMPEPSSIAVWSLIGLIATARFSRFSRHRNRRPGRNDLA